MMIKNCKILVVGDNDPICRLLMTQLLMTQLLCCGFDVIFAKGGQDAIKKFNNEPFDLVLAEIDMSGINGSLLAQYILNVTMEVPVIGISGETWIAGAYFDTVIEKPFELKFLLDSIEYCCSENLERTEQYKVRSVMSG